MVLQEPSGCTPTEVVAEGNGRVYTEGTEGPGATDTAAGKQAPAQTAAKTAIVLLNGAAAGERGDRQESPGADGGGGGGGRKVEGVELAEVRSAQEEDALLESGSQATESDDVGSTEADAHGTHKESAFSIGMQVLLPFLLAGFGMVAAGMVLDIVQQPLLAFQACSQIAQPSLPLGLLHLVTTLVPSAWPRLLETRP